MLPEFLAYYRPLTEEKPDHLSRNGSLCVFGGEAVLLPRPERLEAGMSLGGAEVSGSR